MSVNRNPVSKPPSRRRELFTWFGALWFGAVAVPVCTAQNVSGVLRSDASVEQLREAYLPAAVLDVLEIQPFRLRVGYEFDWLQSRPYVQDGLLVVLKVDPSLVAPRNAAERVLYAGDRTVQRLNQGDTSGIVVGIIPGDLDLAAEPLWFGRPELPERVTTEVIKGERTLADSAGIKPFAGEKVKAVRRTVVEAADLAELLRGAAAELVLKYSPDEKDLAATWRLPTVGSKGAR